MGQQMGQPTEQQMEQPTEQPTDRTIHPYDWQQNWHKHFVADLSPAGALTCVIVRARQRMVTIADIEPPHTESTEGWRLLTAANIPGSNRLQLFGSETALLASERIGYIGEPVALMIADSQQKALTHAEAVAVRYVPVPPDAAEDRTEDWKNEEQGEIVASNEEIEDGNTVVGRYSTGAQGCLRLASQGAVALRDGDHCLVYCATQWPFHVRRTVAAALDIPEQNCCVRVCRIDLQMEDRLWFPSHIAALAALGAWHSDRPVRLILDGREEFRYSPKRIPVRFDVRTTPTEHNLLNMKARIEMTTGSMSPMAPEVSERLRRATLGEYRWGTSRIDVVTTPAQLPPLDICGDMGDGAAIFALETHLNRIAIQQQESPVGFRLARLPEKGVAATVLQTAATAADFDRKYAAFRLQSLRRGHSIEVRRGIGIALSGQHSDLGVSAAGNETRVGLDILADGSAHFRCTGVSRDWKAPHTWRAEIAELLALDPKAVQIGPVDSDCAPDSGPSIAGRNITTIMRLARVCCYSARRKPGAGPRYEEAVLRYSGQRSRHRFSRAAAVVEVAFDPCLLTIDIRGIWLTVHAGAILQHDVARATIQRDVIAALRWILGPELDYSRGQLADDIYDRLLGLEYAQEGRIWVDFLESTQQARGVGGLAHGCVAAALAAALSQTLDCTIERLPISEAQMRAWTKKAGAPEGAKTERQRAP